MDFLRQFGRLEIQYKLSREWLEWARRLQRGIHDHLFSVRGNAQHRERRARRSQFRLQNGHGPANAPRRNFSRRQAFDGFQSNKIRKIEESLAPPRSREHQPQTRPVIKLAARNAHHAFDFISRVAVFHSACSTWVPKVPHYRSKSADLKKEFFALWITLAAAFREVAGQERPACAAYQSC